MAVIKINADLERVGDQAVNIAQRVLDLISEPPVELPVDVPKMASSVSTMVQRALECVFLDGHAEVAESVLQMDNVVDRMKDDAFVVPGAKDANGCCARAARFECTADLAQPRAHSRPRCTNIAEDVIFRVQGADVRHGGAHYPYCLSENRAEVAIRTAQSNKVPAFHDAKRLTGTPRFPENRGSRWR